MKVVRKFGDITVTQTHATDPGMWAIIGGFALPLGIRHNWDGRHLVEGWNYAENDAFRAYVLTPEEFEAAEKFTR